MNLNLSFTYTTLCLHWSQQTFFRISSSSMSLVTLLWQFNNTYFSCFVLKRTVRVLYLSMLCLFIDVTQPNKYISYLCEHCCDESILTILLHNIVFTESSATLVARCMLAILLIMHFLVVSNCVNKDLHCLLLNSSHIIEM